ncbi:MAG: 3'(2'),5'-bisphosphate nucleotidase CysQ [Acidimicrobiia bacterium]|nr:3'(2'),5'-bisphosphate nucleotidase CysQ [Acidimicrobiia bacterium]
MVTSNHQVSTMLAHEAGELLVRVRSELSADDATTLRATGDRRSHDLLMSRLAELRPDDAVLSEEGSDDPVRLESDRVWIVDPLDGTREFSEPPRTDWAVHVALWERGQLVAGAVALPALGVTLGTDPAPATPARPTGRLRVVASRTRPGPAADAVTAALDATLVPMGSAGAKAMAVVRGEAEIYAHTGGQYEWDSAAPVAVARAAGLHASRIDGTALEYNQPDVYLPDLLICRPELATRCIEALRGCG